MSETGDSSIPELFKQALRLAPAKRTHLIEEIIRKNASLGEELKSLIAQDDQEGALPLDPTAAPGPHDQLDHPGVVPVHDFGVDSKGRVYFTMPMVRGRTLGNVFYAPRRGRGASPGRNHDSSAAKTRPPHSPGSPMLKSQASAPLPKRTSSAAVRVTRAADQNLIRKHGQKAHRRCLTEKMLQGRNQMLPSIDRACRATRLSLNWPLTSCYVSRSCLSTRLPSNSG